MVMKLRHGKTQFLSYAMNFCPPWHESEQRRAEALFGQARVVIGETVQRVQIARQLQTMRQSSALRDIGQALITTFDVDGLSDVLVARLPELGIRSTYLALYDNQTTPLTTSRLIMAYVDNERVALGENGRSYPSATITSTRCAAESSLHLTGRAIVLSRSSSRNHGV